MRAAESRPRRRLRRSDCSGPGVVRRRHGRGFSYLDHEGGRVGDEDTLERIRGLAIPPAWQEVWICSDPLGHVQATGVDEAGRKQYLYHERWQLRAAQRKFESMREFASALPQLRRAVKKDLAREGMPRERALACAVRLLDLGFFRIGGEEYAEANESYGVATVLREHVSIEGEELVFDFPAKSGQRVRATAGVSRRSFDTHFEGVADCFLAALEMRVGRTLAAAAPFYLTADDWASGVHRMISSLCRHLACDPTLTSLAFPEVFSPGPEAIQWRSEMTARLATMLRRGAPPERQPSRFAAEASVGAIWGVIHHFVAIGRGAQLSIAAPMLSYIALAPALGGAAAVEVILAEDGERRTLTVAPGAGNFQHSIDRNRFT